MPTQRRLAAAPVGMLNDRVKAAGILHHRGYVHPSCLMVERSTLEEFGLSFLNEKHLPSRLDVGERLSLELKARGFEVAGLRATRSRRGSISEPVDIGVEYEGIVRHQWYTTRAATVGGRQVDDVPPAAIEESLRELLQEWQAEPRELTVVVGARVTRTDRSSPQLTRVPASPEPPGPGALALSHCRGRAGHGVAPGRRCGCAFRPLCLQLQSRSL